MVLIRIAMKNKIFELLSKEASGTEIVLICIGSILFIAFTLFLIKVCKDFVKASGRDSHSIIKIIMIALFPLIFNVTAIFNYVLPTKLIFLLTAVMCVIVVIWNLRVYGPIGGLMLSYLHILGGLLAGLFIAAFVLMAVFFVIMLLTGSFNISGAGSSASSSGAPEYIRDVNTNESFYVHDFKGASMQIIRNGDYIVVYPSDYAGRYHDNYGHNYIAC